MSDAEQTFEEGDRVRLRDKHSDHDGEVGQVTQVMKTMFDDRTYTVGFDDGQESGIPPDQLEAVGGDDEEDEEE